MRFKISSFMRQYTENMNLLISYILLTGLIMTAHTSEPRSYGSAPDSYEVASCEDFQVTGLGDNPAWEKARWMILPSMDEIQEYDTQVKVLYSGTGIYVFAALMDEKIVSIIEEDNADLWEEDIFEVFLHPDETYPLYFEYQVSPKGYELKLLVPNFDGEFLGWLPWKYSGERKVQKKVIITDLGWKAEVFIPFALLEPLRNVPAVKGSRWRANFYRMDYDTGEREKYAWCPVETNFHQYRKFGTLIFK
jgi:hypothetical protein